MRSEWPLARLGDVCDLCLGKMLDQKKNRGAYRKYLGNSNVRWGSFDLDDLAIMKFEDNELDRYSIKSGDLIICEGGEPGRCAIWKDEMPSMFIQKALHRVRTNPELDNRFLFYWLFFVGQRGLLEPYFTGTTIKHLTGKALKEIRIPLPPIATQYSIAATLSALDDKIALNTKINRNLEQIAQAIFKSWFVDFEPWGGIMPDGWREGVLGDICTYSKERISVSDLTLSTYISTENMQPNKAGYVDAESLPTTSQTTAFQEGFVLISNIRPYFKKIVFCNFTGGCSGDVLCFCPNENVPSTFLYSTLFCDQFFEYMVAGSKGTKMPRGDKTQIMQFLISIPSKEVLAQFDNIVKPVLSSINERKTENTRLAAIRDALLPKLMSGEIKSNEEI